MMGNQRLREHARVLDEIFLPRIEFVERIEARRADSAHAEGIEHMNILAQSPGAAGYPIASPGCRNSRILALWIDYDCRTFVKQQVRDDQ